MSKKSKTITILTTLIASVFIFLIGWHKDDQDVAREVYPIYLDGKNNLVLKRLIMLIRYIPRMDFQ